MSSPVPAEISPVMNPDDDALEMLENRLSGLATDDRNRVAECLATIRECLTRGQGIWQAYADDPGESDVAYTPVMRVGPERARDLHRIHLELHDHARTLTSISGVSFRDTIGFSPQIDVVEAYSELGADESGAQRATTALRTMAQRIDRVKQLEDRSRS